MHSPSHRGPLHVQAPFPEGRSLSDSAGTGHLYVHHHKALSWGVGAGVLYCALVYCKLALPDRDKATCFSRGFAPGDPAW